MFLVNKTGEVYVVDAETGKAIRQANLGNDVDQSGLRRRHALSGADERQPDRARREHREAEVDVQGRLRAGVLAAGHRRHRVLRVRRRWLLRARRRQRQATLEGGARPRRQGEPVDRRRRRLRRRLQGTIWALDARTGKRNWSTDTTQLPPDGTGGFYSSPSVAFGKVYEARDDGTVYALDQATGKLAWNFATSNSIYSSPAAAQVPGTQPSVYVGSYDHQLYALDAATGQKRWVFDVGGVVPGTPTVVGRTVYTSSFQKKKTFGVDAKTGKTVFEWGSAGFTPVISDGEQHLYLTGFQTVWAFDAKDAGNRRRRLSRSRARRRPTRARTAPPASIALLWLERFLGLDPAPRRHLAAGAAGARDRGRGSARARVGATCRRCCSGSGWPAACPTPTESAPATPPRPWRRTPRRSGSRSGRRARRPRSPG